MGIVTDSYAIFVEIDLDSFERNINELKGRADFSSTRLYLLDIKYWTVFQPRLRYEKH